MKAVVVEELGAIDNGRLAEIADPAPGPEQVLVEVHAVPVNFVDIVTITGRYQFKPKLPYIPGKGPAGIVRSVGAGVSRVRPGDRVLAMAEYGGYAQLVVADASQCYRLPDGLGFPAAAAMALAFDTAWVALFERCRLQPGERVLVLGASGAVGSAAVQLAKAAGCQVLAGVSSPDKAPASLAAGADHAIDLSREPLADALKQQVLDATQGHGADVVVDVLGGDVFDAAIRAVAWRGRLVVVGFAAGRIATLKTNYLLLKNIEVSGLQISDYRRRMSDLLDRCFDEVFRFAAAGRITPPPVRALPLERFAEGMHAVAGRSALGRVVLLPQE